ncbi:MAG TPA: hypothetical protein VK507_08195, partial [Iamia sp.]|nr:hypothetical protein [Iamia sp.]
MEEGHEGEEHQGWLRVPLGDPHWTSSRVERTILVVARTLVSTSWMLDILPELVSDPRVQVVFTVESDRPSVYRQGAVDLLGELGIPIVPWDQATSTRFDLAMSASDTGDLHELRTPLLQLPHGPGVGKRVALPRGGRPPITRAGDRGAVPATTTVVAHSNQLDLYDPADGYRVLVAGDPVYDRLVVSERHRPRYRSAYGVASDEVLVVLSSTWGLTSQFAKHPDLAHRLLREVSIDRCRVAAILHPNLWIGHGAWQVRTWMRDAIDAGLVLVPPRDAWRSAVVAADLVIADHGSVAFYAAASGAPLLLAGFHDADVLPDSTIGALGRAAPRLDLSEPLDQQVSTHATGRDPDRYRTLVERMFEHPGRALENIRRAIYDAI